ncbi:MAG: helix-turn-helix domain-containing protein [Thiohalomonadaceae bacterium]
MTDEQRAKSLELYCEGISQYEIARRLGVSRDEVHGYLTYTDEYKQRQAEKKLSKSNRGEGTVLSNGYDVGGNYCQAKLLSLQAIENATPEDMLELHGLDSREWRIKSCTNNFYEMQKKGGSILPLYQSKIIAEPCIDQWAVILDRLQETTQPITVEAKELEPEDRYLIVAINDTHFGSNTAKDYADSQQKIINLINDRDYKEIVIYLGGDIFNANSGTSKTVHDTRVADFDMGSAWCEAEDYINPIVCSAIENAPKVWLMFLPGNHSETLEYGFAKVLEERYPQLYCDLEPHVFLKALLLGSTLVGFSHGYKNQKNTPINLALDFSELWGQSTAQECVVCHKHVETVDKGVLLRVMPTRASDAERYVRENNFVRSHKAFMCLEYGSSDIERVYYV